MGCADFGTSQRSAQIPDFQSSDNRKMTLCIGDHQSAELGVAHELVQVRSLWEPQWECLTS
jgi:hypothetical protein